MVVEAPVVIDDVEKHFSHVPIDRDAGQHEREKQKKKQNQNNPNREGEKKKIWLIRTVFVIPSVNFTILIPRPPFAGFHSGSSEYTSFIAEASEFAGL